MNTTKFAPANWICVASIIFSVTGAVLGLCLISVPGIVLALIGGITGIAAKLVGKKYGMNERIINAAFILGILSMAFAIFGTIVAAVIDKIFASAQI